MGIINVGMQIIQGVKPTIKVSIDNGSMNPVSIDMSPAEVKAFGLQCKVLADSVERMVVEVTQ